MKIRTSEYFIKEVFRSLMRNNWMSVASVGTVAVSLFILGMFSMLVLNMNKMAETLESQVQINVYLKEDVHVEDIQELEEELRGMQGVERVTFVDKEEAMERFKERLGDQSSLLDAIEDTNPLPDAFEVELKEPSLVRTAAESISRYDIVESAKYGQDVIDNLFDITRLIRLFGTGLMLLLAAATLFIISNTIRLTVFARRKEIAIMKYVGATNWFIRWPFLLEGMVLGLFGGIIADIVLRFGYSAMTERIYTTLAFFPLIPEQPFLDYISITIVAVGMFIGALGSTISLKRFLEV